jgi:hypothetical protein
MLILDFLFSGRVKAYRERHKAFNRHIRKVKLLEAMPISSSDQLKMK